MNQAIAPANESTATSFAGRSVLVTGGCGYIGSHAVLHLLRLGARVIVLDRLLPGRASPSAIDRIRTALANTQSKSQDHLHVYIADCSDEAAVASIMQRHQVEDVLHFAGLAYVAESVARPDLYYRENLGSSAPFLRAAFANGCRRLVVSSSCTAYGEHPSHRLPLTEDQPCAPTHPYGMSKWMLERMAFDIAGQYPACGVAALRYFNVAGCDQSGILREEHDPETHVIPILLNCARTGAPFKLMGTDYPPPSPDGTAVRDYIHVDDVVSAHVLMLQRLAAGNHWLYNVGLGQGISLRMLIDAVQRVTGRAITIQHAPRRPGDAPAMFASSDRLIRDHGWKPAVTSLEAIIASAQRGLELPPLAGCGNHPAVSLSSQRGA